MRMSGGQEGPLYGSSLNTLGGPPGLRKNKIHSLESCKVTTQFLLSLLKGDNQWCV